MVSAAPKIYPLGSRVLFTFACTAPSGVSTAAPRLAAPDPGGARSSPKPIRPREDREPHVAHHRQSRPREVNHDDLAVAGRALHHRVGP